MLYGSRSVYFVSFEIFLGFKFEAVMNGVIFWVNFFLSHPYHITAALIMIANKTYKPWVLVEINNHWC